MSAIVYVLLTYQSAEKYLFVELLSAKLSININDTRADLAGRHPLSAPISGA
jgi:hypothetical protein